MRNIIAIVVAILLIAPAARAGSVQLKMLSSFPTNYLFYTDLGAKFVEMVTKKSDGNMEIKVVGPDAIPAFEQLEPVQAGAFDILFSHPAYHSGTSTIGIAMDAMATDFQKRRDSGVFGYIDKFYNSIGLKLLSAPSIGSKGFYYYLSTPVKQSPGLSGMKIRGTVSYHPMIRALGGAPVNMPGGEVYSSLQKGVVDGAAWTRVGVVDLKWYEVASYIATPSFGQVSMMFFINLDKFKKLNPSQQKILIEVGAELESYSLKHFDLIADKEREELLKLGMKSSHFAPDDASRLEKLWADGVWEVAAGKSTKVTKELRELGKKGGLTY